MDQQSGITLEATGIPKGAEDLWRIFSYFCEADTVSTHDGTSLSHFSSLEVGLSFNNLVQGTMSFPQITSRVIETRESYDARVNQKRIAIKPDIEVLES